MTKIILNLTIFNFVLVHPPLKIASPFLICQLLNLSLPNILPQMCHFLFQCPTALSSGRGLQLPLQTINKLSQLLILGKNGIVLFSHHLFVIDGISVLQFDLFEVVPHKLELFQILGVILLKLSQLRQLFYFCMLFFNLPGLFVVFDGVYALL